jgi:hypothetical protein
MATWLGMAPPTASLLLNSANTTSFATAAFDLAHRAYPPSNLVSNGANVSAEPVDVSPHNSPNPPTALMMSPGDLIFERIHVFPQVKSLPMIISPSQIVVEVWNAFRNAAQNVSAVTITGPAGVSILTPHAVPIAFGKFQSRLYTVLVDVNGAPNADNFVTWDFDGLSEPSFHVTGLRLLPFTISPDWQSGMEETITAMTDIMRAYDDTEQRMQLRENLKRNIQYQATALSSRESGLMMSLLWAWQGRAYGVLLWMDNTPMTTNVLAGTQLVTVDTSNMTLADGVDTVILIKDAFTWFASQVQSHDAGSITLATPSDKDFFATETLVVPVKLGRIPDSLPVPLPTNKTATTQISFDIQTTVTS